MERVNKSGARFDVEKTKWYNHQYLQNKSNATLAELYSPILTQKEVPSDFLDASYIEKVVGLIKERANFVSDFWELSNYFFLAPKTYAEKPAKKQWKEDTSTILKQVAEVLEKVSDFTSVNTEAAVKEWITENELGFGKVMGPLRIAIVGDLKGPHLFDILAMVGKEDSLERVAKAISVLG